MKPLLFYILQVVVCSGLLYGYYHLFLRNKRFHQYNRHYLLAIAVISIFVPFLNIPVYFNAEQTAPLWIQTLDEISVNSHSFFAAEAQRTASTIFTFNNILLILYVSVSCFLFFRLVMAIIKIRKIAGLYQVEKMEGINFVNTDEKETPFSFFHWLFWNKRIQLDSPEGQQIFRHELYHIRQKHSLDILFIELLTLVFWINPFFHLLKKELTTIHEFLADQFAIRQQEKWSYAELLLMHLLDSPHLRFTNPFFHTQIKRRIAMITNSPKTSHQYLRKLMVLPVVATLIILFAFKYKNKENDMKEQPLPELTVSPIDTIPGKAAKNPIRPETNTRSKVFEKVEIEPSFPGGENAWKKYTEEKQDMSVLDRNNAPAGEYTVYIQFIVRTNGSIKDVRPLTNHGFGMEKEGARIIKQGPKWIPAIHQGKAVDAYKKQRFDFTVSKPGSTTGPAQPAANKNGPSIKLADLRKADFHQILNLTDESEIVSYRLAIDRDNDILEVINIGEEISSATRSLINGATAGRLLTIEDIKIRKSNKEMKIPSRFFYVIN
ncbi:MAG: energy transducer TonB [Chitinophagaceae bacterium]|nr:energy transducer TonB [Chitinophagaceae bacterium]